MIESGSPAITLRSVSVSYRRSDPVVKDVSMTVEAGSWLAIIGPNGAGKSSLLKAIGNLVTSTGSIIIGEQAIATDGRPAAYVAQSPMLPPGMTVAEYVLLGRTAHLRWLQTEGRRDRETVDRILARLSLTEFAARPLTELSGGEVQRATLARALAQEAPLLLLDEPTSALDIGHRIAVLELIDELRRERGLTIVSALHDLDSAGRYADRLALLDQGELVAIGAPDNVLTEAILSKHYRTPVQILIGPDGGPVIVPLRQRSGDLGLVVATDGLGMG